MKIRHGGDLAGFSEKYNVPEKEIVDFSSNINPLGLPASVRDLYLESAGDLSIYPDSEAREFRRTAAQNFPLWAENVIAGNGAMELLDVIIRFLKPKKAFFVEPCFLEYRRLFNLAGAEVRTLCLKENENFNFSPAEIMNGLRGNDLLLLSHPNNPTGTALSREDLFQILQEARRRNIFVVLDEAFVDWAPENSMAKEIRDDSHFFVVRSLTKFFALPGIRIGYGLGARKLIEKLSATQAPWSCNRLAQKLGTAALKDEAFIRKSRVWLESEKEWLSAQFRDLGRLKVYPSLANFFLIRHTAEQGAEPIGTRLGREGIYVRDLSDFPGLGASFFRIGIRKREDNEKLINALKKISEERNPVRLT